jgi:hypothetical protein
MEFLKHNRFTIQEIYPCKHSKIINKTDIVSWGGAGPQTSGNATSRGEVDIIDDLGYGS